MNDLLRAASIAAAVALVVAPYRAAIALHARAVLEAVRQHSDGLLRFAAAAALVGYGAGFLKLPTLPTASVPVVRVETPTSELQAVVAPIAKSLASASPVDRAIWASVWEKAAVVVSAPESSEQVVFSDTRSLRGFTVLAIDIAWRRLGGNPPGKYPGLREGVEAAFKGVVGMDVVPVTPDMRAKYAATCRAIAWAGINGG